MPASGRLRNSCCTKKYDSDHKLLALFLVIAFLTVIVALVLLGTGYGAKYYAALALANNSTLVKPRVADATTVVYATVTATATNLLTSVPTHASVVVDNGLTSGAVVGICFAVVCGVLLIIGLLTCVARCLACKVVRLTGAGARHAENRCEEPQCGTGPSVKEKVGAGFSLRRLFGRGGLTGGNSVNSPSAEGYPAAGGAVANHSAGVMAVGNDPAGNRSAGDQPAGNHPSEK